MTNDTENTPNTAAPMPVDGEENREVDGHGLVCKKNFDRHVATVARLRKRQQAYEESLPKDPVEALEEIRRALKDGSAMSEPEYAARAALEIIRQLALHEALDGSDQMCDALAWLADQGLDALKALEDGTSRAHDIARRFHKAYVPFEA